VFNKNFTHDIPISLYHLQRGLGMPSLFAMILGVYSPVSITLSGSTSRKGKHEATGQGP